MRAVLKWGALTGIGAYVITRIGFTYAALYAFGAAPAGPNNPGPIMFGCIGIFVILFMFSAAGYYAGGATRSAGIGALAGLLSCAVYAAASAVYTPGQAASTAVTGAGNSTTRIVTQAVAAVAVFGIAALMGWLGGRPGAKNARKADQASTSSPV